MSHDNDHELRQLLKESIPPAAHSDLARDLWPQMLEKLDRQPISVAWFDWVLAALGCGALLFFPGIIPALFYHL